MTETCSTTCFVCVGLLGEKTIFRRRAEQEPEPGTPQLKPKLLRLVVDVSGSMYRFNSYDGRLDRQLEAVVLVMEAFEGFEDKIQYDIFGHSGDTDRIEFVNRNNPPKNNKQRLDLIRVREILLSYNELQFKYFFFRQWLLTHNTAGQVIILCLLLSLLLSR